MEALLPATSLYTTPLTLHPHSLCTNWGLLYLLCTLLGHLHAFYGGRKGTNILPSVYYPAAIFTSGKPSVTPKATLQLRGNYKYQHALLSSRCRCFVRIGDPTPVS